MKAVFPIDRSYPLVDLSVFAVVMPRLCAAMRLCDCISNAETYLYEMKQMKKIIEKLTHELNYYKNIGSMLANSDIGDIECYLERGCIEHYTMPSNYQYAAHTITFDPSRFEDLTNNEEQILYILNVIKKCLKKSLFNIIYGSFELTKNGIIHAHIITDCYGYENLMKQNNKLKRSFTHNPNNKHCVLSKFCDSPTKWLTYINKDPIELFKNVSKNNDNKYNNLENNSLEINSLDI